MDSRKTLVSNGTFIEMLASCKDRNEKVAMLVDHEGITRAGGFVKEIVTNIPAPYIEMDNGDKILLTSIIAVNGVFVSSYSEC